MLEFAALVNCESFSFGLFVKQNKILEEDILGSGGRFWLFFMFYRPND